MKRLIVTLVALAAIGTACADVTTDALSVNGETFGRGELIGFIADVQAEIDELLSESEASGDANFAALSDQLGAPNGTMGSDIAAQVLNIYIWNEILRQHLVAEGTDISPGDGIIALPPELQTGFATFDEVNGEFQARQAQTDPNVIGSLINGADVQLDARFGTWIDGQIVPNFAAGS